MPMGAIKNWFKENQVEETGDEGWGDDEMKAAMDAVSRGMGRKDESSKTPEEEDGQRPAA
jgi:hypothetical protein